MLSVRQIEVYVSVEIRWYITTLSNILCINNNTPVLTSKIFTPYAPIDLFIRDSSSLLITVNYDDYDDNNNHNYCCSSSSKEKLKWWPFSILSKSAKHISPGNHQSLRYCRII